MLVLGGVGLRVLEVRVKCVQRGLHGGDEVVGGRGAGREAHSVSGMKPIGAKVGGRLDVVDAPAEFRAGLYEFAGVVAVGSADDDHDVAFLREIFRGALPLLGGLADRINEPDFGSGKPKTETLGKVADASGGLGRLRSNTEAFTRGELVDVGFSLDDVKGSEVFGEAADFDMAALADDDGVVTVRDQPADGAVREGHERAGSFEEFESVTARFGNGPSGRAMSGDHRGGGLDAGGIGFELDAAAAEIIKDGFVVNEFTENGEWLLAGFCLSESNGIAHAEAHSEMFRFDNIHINRSN